MFHSFIIIIIIIIIIAITTDIQLLKLVQSICVCARNHTLFWSCYSTFVDVCLCFVSVALLSTINGKEFVFINE